MAHDIPRGQPPPPHPTTDRCRRRHNPLRRPTDRARTWISLALALTVTATAPAAMFKAGDTAYHHYRSTAAQETRTRDHRPATLVHDTPRHPEPGSDEAKKTRYRAEVRYTAPDGTPRTGSTGVEPGLPADSTVLVWIDHDGTLTTPPLTPDEIRSRTMGWAVLAFLAVALAGLAAHAAATRALHRRDLAQWDAAWAATAPRWSSSP